MYRFFRLRRECQWHQVDYCILDSTLRTRNSLCDFALSTLYHDAKYARVCAFVNHERGDLSTFPTELLSPICAVRSNGHFTGVSILSMRRVNGQIFDDKTLPIQFALPHPVFLPPFLSLFFLFHGDARKRWRNFQTREPSGIFGNAFMPLKPADTKHCCVAKCPRIAR